MEDAYYKAGEIYLYKFNDPEKALECFDAFIGRFTAGNDLPMVYYMAYAAANQQGQTAKAEKYKAELLQNSRKVILPKVCRIRTILRKWTGS